jgi:hypothetical protein
VSNPQISAAPLTITHVLVDTNNLRNLRHPDFQKVVRLSRERGFKIVVPYISWEERRTQLLQDEFEQVEALRGAYETLRAKRADSIVGRLTPLAPIRLWDNDELVQASRRHMEEVAAANAIEVLPLDPQHAPPAWESYFEATPPFLRRKDRQNIPDSWIYQAAVAFRKDHGQTVVLCKDENLVDSLRSRGLTVFKVPRDLLAALEPPQPAATPPAAPASTPAPASAQGSAAGGSPLESLLAASLSTSREVDRKILGIVGYLGQVSKRELDEVMTIVHIDAEFGRNAAQRLVLAQLIHDTGNHYLPRDSTACDLAATEVEDLMIELVRQGWRKS